VRYALAIQADIFGLNIVIAEKVFFEIITRKSFFVVCLIFYPIQLVLFGIFRTISARFTCNSGLAENLDPRI